MRGSFPEPVLTGDVGSFPARIGLGTVCGIALRSGFPLFGVRVPEDVAGHVDDHRTVGILLGHHTEHRGGQ
jgi:hypothetical protein